MNITDAGAFQTSFDAVLAGTASDAQCTEVKAVTKALRGYLQEADLRAKALPERRDAFSALLSPAAATKLAALLPAPGAPRLDIDPVTGLADTPANIAAAATARAAAAAAATQPATAAATVGA